MTSDDADEIAQSLNRIADALKDLGKGDASDPQGAIEFLAMAVERHRNNDETGAAIDNLAGAIRDGASEIAEAINNTA